MRLRLVAGDTAGACSTKTAAVCSVESAHACSVGPTGACPAESAGACSVESAGACSVKFAGACSIGSDCSVTSSVSNATVTRTCGPSTMMWSDIFPFSQ